MCLISKHPPSLSRFRSSHSGLLRKITRLQISCHTRQFHHQSIQLLGHLNLAPQAGRIRKTKRQIEHVVLVVRHVVCELVVQLLVLEDDVTCRTCAAAAARAFHLEIICLGDVEEVVAVGYFEGVGVLLLVDYRDFAPTEMEC